MSVLIPGARSVIQVGGRVFTDLNNLLIFRARTSTTATGANCTMRVANGTAGYAVTTGKTLTIRAIKAVGDVASAFTYFSLLYSDNDMGFATNNAATNAVHAYGASSESFGTDPTLENNTFNTNFAIPAAKYPGVIDGNTGAGLGYEIYGYEA